MMAAHYGVGIVPARPYRPRDKAKVEAGVRFARATFSDGCGIRRSSRSPKPIAQLRRCAHARMVMSCGALG
jgi:transposase